LPRRGRKRPDAFTLILVRHDEKPPVSVRVPLWTVYVTIGLCAVGLACLVYFALDYQDATSQLAALRRGDQQEMVSEKNLRNTIASDKQQQDSLRSVIVDQQAEVSQQVAERADDISRFNDEVTRLSSQLSELEQFKADIRHMVGLDRVPAVSPTPSAPKAQAETQAAIGPLQPLPDEHAAPSLSSRGSSDVMTSIDDVVRSTEDLLNNTIPQQKADLEALEQSVSERLSKVGTDWSTPEELSSQLDLYDASPRAWPVYGPIEAPFGYDIRRIQLGVQPFHEGIDIGANIGTPVRAPQDGTVTFAGWNGTYGLELEVAHSMGWSTLYAHLSSIPVKVGSRVQKGQVIGYVGLTGATTGPHLHYEIHLNGTPVDPAKYLGK
jgi:murein DD-endopeptidase MepM/ murein hydrolase activator NlpD